MLSHRRLSIIASLILLAGFVSCTKDPELPDGTSEPGNLRISFTNRFGDNLLRLNTETYVTVNSDTLTCSLFKYYISNIVLTDADGNTWAETESYHLLDQSEPASLNITLNNLPAKKYSSIRFMVGVDSTRNVSGSQTGALDPAHGMFWTWNSGYIFAKFEGNSPQSILPAHSFVYHIGGYSGPDATQRMVTIPFGANPVTISSGRNPLVEIKADAAKWFGPEILSISETPSINDFGPLAAGVADNYANMFSLVRVQN